MAESALARLGEGQRRHLVELGLQPLRLRSVAAPARSETRDNRQANSAWLAMHDGSAVPHEHALVQAIVRALGPELVASLNDSRRVEPALRLPALTDLRRGAAKRALWPALRRLRRDGAGAE